MDKEQDRREGLGRQRLKYILSQRKYFLHQKSSIKGTSSLIPNWISKLNEMVLRVKL